MPLCNCVDYILLTVYRSFNTDQVKGKNVTYDLADVL